MRTQYILTVSGELLGGYTSFSHLIRDIGKTKLERTHRRTINEEGVLELGAVKVEKTKLIISKRKNTNHGEQNTRKRTSRDR